MELTDEFIGYGRLALRGSYGFPKRYRDEELLLEELEEDADTRYCEIIAEHGRKKGNE